MQEENQRVGEERLLKEKEHRSEVQELREQHEEQLCAMVKRNEERFFEVKEMHAKDRNFMDGLLKRAQEKLKHDGSEERTYLEMENKYLRDIRDLTDGFDAYKAQMELEAIVISKDKLGLLKRVEESEI